MGFEESIDLLTFGNGESPSAPRCPASNGEVDGHCGVAVVDFLVLVVDAQEGVAVVAFLVLVVDAQEGVVPRMGMGVVEGPSAVMKRMLHARGFGGGFHR